MTYYQYPASSTNLPGAHHPHEVAPAVDVCPSVEHSTQAVCPVLRAYIPVVLHVVREEGVVRVMGRCAHRVSHGTRGCGGGRRGGRERERAH